MPKPTCQLNLTLEVPVAEHVEKISREANYRPSGAGRVMLQQRLDLEAAGWKIDDKELFTILESVCRLKPESLKTFAATLRTITTNEASDEIPRTGNLS